MDILSQSFIHTGDSTGARDGRVRVKICGITNPQDALNAVELGADALGFNLYTGSKRYIDLKKEEDWIRALPPHITKVAVMVNPSSVEAEAVFKLPYIDMVQFHGDEDEAFCRHFADLGLPFIKAIAVKDEASVRNLERFGTPHILVDAYSPDAYGGTGRLIDPGLLKALAPDSNDDFRLILSGGLKPGNVRAAIDQIHPHAVDVASGVESAPGRKGRALMEDFMRAVQRTGS